MNVIPLPLITLARPPPPPPPLQTPQMYCVMNATLVSVLGPTFALNGPKGSMHESVQYMKEERLMILSAFWTGACCFGIAQIFTFWIIAPQETALPCTIAIVLGFEVRGSGGWSDSDSGKDRSDESRCP